MALPHGSKGLEYNFARRCAKHFPRQRERRGKLAGLFCLMEPGGQVCNNAVDKRCPNGHPRLRGGAASCAALPTNRCHSSKSIVFFFLFHFTATGFAE
jgi:hypothetical protein